MVPLLTFASTSDLADTFPDGEFADYFRSDWITTLIKETRANRDYSPRTIETARWARIQVKRQTEPGQGGASVMI
jgi:importin subunit beta-1